MQLPPHIVSSIQTLACQFFFLLFIYLHPPPPPLWVCTLRRVCECGSRLICYSLIKRIWEESRFSIRRARCSVSHALKRAHTQTKTHTCTCAHTHTNVLMYPMAMEITATHTCAGFIFFLKIWKKKTMWMLIEQPEVAITSVFFACFHHY